MSRSLAAEEQSRSETTVERAEPVHLVLIIIAILLLHHRVVFQLRIFMNVFLQRDHRQILYRY